MSLRARFEVAMIRIAASILMYRNVDRAGVTSRSDNNDMWYTGERLHAIANRILDGYERPSLPNETRRREAAAAMYCAGLSTDELEKRVGEGEVPTMDADHD